jgi:hypothetical protein
MMSAGRKCDGHTRDFYLASSPEVNRARNICNGMDGYFIKDEEGNVIAEVPGRICPYRDTCLRYAIDENEGYGVWGGTSERDRRKIARARNRLGDTRIYTLEDVAFPGVVTVRRQHVVVRRRAVNE